MSPSELELDLARRFTYHPPVGDQQERYHIIRKAARYFAEIIATKCPDSQERSQAFMNLEQSVMWANASIARTPVEENHG